MSWTCPHWVDMYTAYIAGLVMGLTVGIWGGIWLYRTIDVRRINEHSQRGPH